MEYARHAVMAWKPRQLALFVASHAERPTYCVVAFTTKLLQAHVQRPRSP